MALRWTILAGLWISVVILTILLANSLRSRAEATEHYRTMLSVIDAYSSISSEGKRISEWTDKILRPCHDARLGWLESEKLIMKKASQYHLNKCRFSFKENPGTEAMLPSVRILSVTGQGWGPLRGFITWLSDIEKEIPSLVLDSMELKRLKSDSYQFRLRFRFFARVIG